MIPGCPHSGSRGVPMVAIGGPHNTHAPPIVGGPPNTLCGYGVALVLTPPQLARGREGELELLKEQLGAAGPPETLSDEELPLDPRLYQELCAGAFDEHGLPWLSDPEDAPFLDPVLRKRAVKVKHVKRREKKSDKKKEERYKRHRQKPRHRERSRHPERADPRDPAGLGQCLGPGCTRPARPPSKYCSEACGVKLAANRIYEILPQRIQQWQQSPCVAEEHGKRLLERIRREQHQARLRLQEMERRFHELEALIARAKGFPAREDEESTEGDSEDTDLQIFCVSCGHPINPKVALRHMERCYAKYESQTSFGSMYPTRIEGATRLFCDVYNPQSKTYCKRLQVLCPEHSRDPKVPADEVCGCPLVRDVFELTGEFCRAPKRRCHRHYCWEKLRRAEVDLERVRVVSGAAAANGLRGMPQWDQWGVGGSPRGPMGLQGHQWTAGGSPRAPIGCEGHPKGTNGMPGAA
uniref:CXXC-type zinc finger protein 1 n=1 Tax=Amazona collaria TaxID=241587 RepID=A0A8B9FV13_9PSIT